MAQTHTQTDGLYDSMTNSAQWGRVGENLNIIISKHGKNSSLSPLRLTMHCTVMSTMQTPHCHLYPECILPPSINPRVSGYIQQTVTSQDTGNSQETLIV